MLAGITSVTGIRALGAPTPRAVWVRYSVTVDFTATVDLIQTTYFYAFEAIPTTQHA
jgi:hypothetical protein